MPGRLGRADSCEGIAAPFSVAIRARASPHWTGWALTTSPQRELRGGTPLGPGPVPTRCRAGWAERIPVWGNAAGVTDATPPHGLRRGGREGVEIQVEIFTILEQFCESFSVPAQRSRLLHSQASAPCQISWPPSNFPLFSLEPAPGRCRLVDLLVAPPSRGCWRCDHDSCNTPRPALPVRWNPSPPDRAA